MAPVPSVSYSITVRLEVPSRGNAVSQLTAAVEQGGGIVTAPVSYTHLRAHET